jgi:hypothetical protein
MYDSASGQLLHVQIVNPDLPCVYFQAEVYYNAEKARRQHD